MAWGMRKCIFLSSEKSPIRAYSRRHYRNAVFAGLCRLLGVTHLRMSAYHPASNGIVDRLHRQLKAAVKCHDTSNWIEILPIVLLGIRTAMKEDLNVTIAEMIYSTGIWLPVKFFLATNQRTNSEFTNLLKERMEKVRPQPVIQHGEKQIFVFGTRIGILAVRILTT